MTHYVQRCNNEVHVTNMVGSYEGQHHVHTEDSFCEWKKAVNEKNIDTSSLKKCLPCDCGLKPGEVRSERAKRGAQ